MIPPPAAAPSLPADRRTALKLGLLAIAGTAGGGRALAAAARGFSHGVASGEPGADRVLLWTRYVADQPVSLRWEMAETADFAAIVAGGECIATPERDHCAKGWATGLAPGRWYYYRFIAPAGERSPTGRTRTLPAGPVDRFRMAVFSCSNYGFGWFNAYAHAAEDGAFDLAVHLGDYLYEYANGTYPLAAETVGGRAVPAGEMVAIADYRERFALYRSDPDLQRLHQLYPMVSVWDDHESANDAWRDGAENHNPDQGEGEWAVRKAASRRVYREWLPVSDDDWASYEIGDLASLFRLETRLTARDRPFDLDLLISNAGPGKVADALNRFRTGAWRDPARQLLGQQQEGWLAAGLAGSTRARKPWQVLIQQVIMGRLDAPGHIGDGIGATAPAAVRRFIATSQATTAARLPWNMDAWDGYPAARDRVFRAALAADANLIVLTGDSHNAWAFDLDRRGIRVGVEFAGSSVTSPGAEHYIGWRPADSLARDLVAASPQLKWCDMARRGYMAVELTPAAATSEYRFMASVRQRGTTLSGITRQTVLAGQRKLSA